MAEPHEFAGRVALVTAAAGKGIGQAVARRLAAGGARVVVTDIHPGRTAKVTAAIAADYPAATVVGYPLDAGDRGQIDAVIAAVTTSLGPVQVLVNNAAVNVVGSIFGYDPADWDRVVRVNLTGAWYLCHRTMPLMRDAGGGVIVNVGSYAPDVGGNGIEAPYAATKGGLAALTRGLAHEGGPHNIRAVYLSMGVVKGTKFAEDNAELLARMPGTTGPLGDLPGPADIAEAVVFLASDRAAFITGEVLNVSGGAYMRNLVHGETPCESAGLVRVWRSTAMDVSRRQATDFEQFEPERLHVTVSPHTGGPQASGCTGNRELHGDPSCSGEPSP